MLAQEQSAEEAPALPPVEDIVVEANVLELTLNDEHRQGVDWAAIVEDFHTVPLQKEDDPAWADPKYRLNVGTVSDDDYKVLLEALDTVGQVARFEQEGFSLNVGQTVSVDLKAGPQNMRVEAGLSKPSSGEPTLSIEPHFALLLPQEQRLQKLPEAVLLKAKTQLAFQDNTTIVIGGFMREEAIIKTRKFPLLGDLPLVGLVFRSQGRLMKKTETVIFLTMHRKPAPNP